MRTFSQRTRARGAYQQAVNGVRFLYTPSYLEFENPLDDGSFGVVYVVPYAGHSYSIHACVPDHVALIMNDYVALDPRRQLPAVEIYEATWPLLTKMRANGVANHYSPVAVTIVQDPDFGIERWAVTTVVGNLDALSGAEMLKNARLVRAMSQVSDSSEAVIHQVSTSPMDDDGLAIARFRSDAIAHVRSATKFLNDNAQPMAKFIKLLAGSG